MPRPWREHASPPDTDAVASALALTRGLLGSTLRTDGRAVRDGQRSGASWAWLQSSSAGYGVHGRLGITTLERWPCWLSQP